MENVDVIIVGAGIAGLAAANQLHQAGKTVLVLEAQDRPGGRICTDRSLGVALDMGASWIHGVKYNPIANLANKYGIKTLQSNTESLSLKRYESLSLYDWTGKPVEAKEIKQLKKQLANLELFIQDAQMMIEKDISYRSIVKKFLSMHRFTERELKIFKYAVSAAIEYEYAEDAAKLSLLEFGKDEPFAGPEVILPDGYDQIIMRLANNLPIQFNQVVKRICYDEKGVEVFTEKEHFKSRVVIITIPLGILKTTPELFMPALPRWKQQAIRRLQMGILNKVYLQFEKPFWDLSSDVIGYIPNTKLSWIEFINYYKYIQKPILMAFNAGSRARQMEQWPAEKIIDSIMQVMKTIYGKDIPEPTGHLITAWDSHPFAKGSYSYLPVGVTGNECDKLAEPVLKRLFFAGEATNYKRLSTVHGAYLSGIEAANKIKNQLK